MSDNEEGRSPEHISWIQNLIAEAEAPAPATASKPVIPAAPKRRVRPTFVTMGESVIATYIDTDGMAVYKPVVGSGGWGW